MTRFVKDMGVYAAGTLGSKLITFMLVPLYTWFIADTSELGYYDLCLTAVFLLMPLVTLQLRDGAFRFLIDDPDPARRRAVVTFVYSTLLRGSMAAIAIGGMLWAFADIPYLPYIVALLVVMSVYEVVMQLVRGLGHTVMFVQGGIITSLGLCVISLLLIGPCDMGLDGIFLANIAARVITLVMIESRLAIIRRYFGYSFADRATNHAILRYSLPLIPGATCLWIVAGSNRFFIEHYLGLADNGQFAVAMKFASILETLAFIFYQTWQEHALRRYGESHDRSRFHTTVFEVYFFVLCGLTALFPFAVRAVYPFIVGADYQTSADYLGLLGLSAMCYSVACFFDLGYQCSLNTMRSLASTAVGAVVSVSACFMLVKPWGVYGVCAASIAAMAVMALWRIVDTRCYMQVRFKGAWLMPLAITIASVTAYQLTDTDIAAIAVIIAALAACVPAVIIRQNRQA